MNRPTKVDWFVYRIFRWWWNPVFSKNTHLVLGMEMEFRKWRIKNVDNVQSQRQVGNAFERTELVGVEIISGGRR